jgi:peptidoglycan/xylan/chitin deacetylase (PgdA/CDA1 family)
MTVIRRVPAPLILMYHSVSSPAADVHHLCVSPARLTQQLRGLASRGLRGVSVRELLAAAARGEGRALVGLTFDDGYADFGTSGAPVLEQLGFTASVFLVTGSLGADSCWDPDFRRPLLTAAQVRDLHRRGFEIGSHAVRHRRLSGLPDLEVRAELADSRRELERILDAPVEGLAYPYGDADPAVQRAAADAGYRYACLAGPTAPPSMFALPRVYLGQRDTPLRLLGKRHGYRLLRRRVELNG